jgi:Nucleotidyl transferase AbiEii toxin, Type IV TA system
MTDAGQRPASPSHATVDGHAFLSLRALAKTDGRATAEYLRLYALEGFLARLATSTHADDLVLKGGVLLAAYALRRPTADIDFAAKNRSNEVEEVRALVTEITQIELSGDDDDGLVFDVSAITAESIREEDEYSGVRVTLRAKLATAVEPFHVDVNVGDPIWPAPNEIQLPKLLGGEIRLLGYPMTMVLAEKAVTALQRSTANTRWRDFGDVYQLTGQHSYSADVARGSLAEVARFRAVELTPARIALDGFAELGQDRYLRWRDRLELGDRLPDSFAEVLEALFAYVDPLVTPDEVLDTASWDPVSRSWA